MTYSDHIEAITIGVTHICDSLRAIVHQMTAPRPTPPTLEELEAVIVRDAVEKKANRIELRVMR